MISLILRTTTLFLLPLLLLFSLFLLLRGHNEPGGGFAGGLVAAAAFALHSIAYDAASTRRTLRVDPRALIALGLCVALASGLPGILLGRPFLTGQWRDLQLPGIGPVAVGTPLVFDAGVYLVVLGVMLTIILTFEEE